MATRGVTGGKADRVQRAPLAAHPAFRPIIAVWLAALAGLAVFVLTAQPITAVAAGAIGAALGWMIAQFAAKNSGKAAIKAESAPSPEQQEEAPLAELPRTPFIDVSELGFPSFDAELPISDPEPALPESATVEAREIDPAEPEEALELVPGKGAAKVLKSQPICQMSLVQMIERFALALDGHREAARHDGAGTIARLPKPALIEAMRTLPAVNPPSLHRFAAHGNAALAADPALEAEETERALREALEKLQRMSGGA